jgi:hypothetical protein
MLETVPIVMYLGWDDITFTTALNPFAVLVNLSFKIHCRTRRY